MSKRDGKREETMSNPFVIIIRGLPGSGKTTIADALVALAPDKIVRLEADDYFLDIEGKYNYDATKITIAHDNCKAKFIMALSNKKSIIVSNTSVKYWEWEEYRDLAETQGYIVHVMVKENYHDGTSSHGVPLATVMKMKNNFSLNLHGRKVMNSSNFGPANPRHVQLSHSKETD